LNQWIAGTKKFHSFIHDLPAVMAAGDATERGADSRIL